MSREELHELVDAIAPEDVDRAAAVLSQFAHSEAGTVEPPWPQSIGSMSAGAPSNLARNADEYLAGGFGR